MSAGALINKFGKLVTVTRYGTGQYVDALYQTGATTTFTTKMSIQPLNGKDLLNLPEGQRTRNLMKAYASVQMYTAEIAASKKADLVTTGGVTYEVQKVESWESSGNKIVPYWKLLLAEVNVQ